MSGTLTSSTDLAGTLDLRVRWRNDRKSINAALIFFDALGAEVVGGTRDLEVRFFDTPRQLLAGNQVQSSGLDLELAILGGTQTMTGSQVREFGLGSGATDAVLVSAPAGSSPPPGATSFRVWLSIEVGEVA